MNNACPSFFKACCIQAQRGGSESYYAAGYELARHLADILEDDADREAFSKKIDIAFNEKDEKQSRELLLKVLQQHLPACIKLVPEKSQLTTFADGFLKCLEDGNSEIA